jgi:hypothetical protein
MQKGYCEIVAWANTGIGLSKPNPIETSNARKNARVIFTPAWLAFLEREDRLSFFSSITARLFTDA